MSLEAAFESFITEGFREACISSTKAGWSGGSYSVELFSNGTYRVLETQLFGSLYQSPGIIIKIPQLGEDDWDENTGHFFLNAQDLMYESFEEAITQEA